MRNAVLLCSLALACASSSLEEPRLYGAWKSNRDLTLAEFRRAPNITPERLQALSAPYLFGHLVTIYRPADAIVIYEGECSVTEYDVVEQADAYVDITYYDSVYDERVTNRIFIEPGSISLRVRDAREIFTPVELGELEAEHKCLQELLQAGR